MSKTKKKKGHADAKPTAKVKRKEFWIKHNSKNKSQKIQHQDNAEPHLSTPPEDAQQFSSNWKVLQETLKASQSEKNPSVTQKQNGVFPKKTFKNIPKTASSDKDNETKAKHTIASKGVVPKESEVNSDVAAASNTQQLTAPKRKRDKGKSDSKQEAKRNKPAVEERKPTEDDLWFDDVDPDDVEETMGAEAAEILRRKQGIHQSKDTKSMLVKEMSFGGLTRTVAIDCEMVGVGPDGEDSILARVSIVNMFGKCIYDKFVKPTEKVTDYRTAVSGIRPEDIKDGEDMQTVQKEVANILQGRIVVGHAIHNDLKILFLDHPKKNIRDTQRYKPFKKIVKSGRPALRVLCKEILNVKVQQGEHSSVQDAQATMRLYTLVKKQWEAEIIASKKNKDQDKPKRNPKKKQNQT
uniref:RNA exonuclease 4 n=1 Tax=Iconisemion striatum TaxID=60296 RepID=A0A1A7XHM2_9TELE